jgi:hypothetical protein
VQRVYHAWGHLDGRPFRLLVYMALIARDHDSEPWFGLGHDALAELALGLDVPKDPKKRDEARRIVRRALTPLHREGAITTSKRQSHHQAVHYRLWLDGPSPDCSQVTERPMNNPVDNPKSQVTERPMSGKVIGHSEAGHRSLNGRSQVTERPIYIEEEEEEEERSSSKPNLRNGEMWKADAPAADANGETSPNGNHPTPTTPEQWAALRAAWNRMYDAADATGDAHAS